MLDITSKTTKKITEAINQGRTSVDIDIIYENWKNKYFLVVKYNNAKDIYQYVISQDGLRYILANIK